MCSVPLVGMVASWLSAMPPANLEAYKDVKVPKKAKERIEAALASIQ